MKTGEIWCHTPEGIAEFENVVTASQVFRSVNHEKPKVVTLDYNVI